MKQINLNDIVTAMLNDRGKEIVKERYKELMLIYPDIFNEKFINNTCHRTEWQLWHLFELFGSSIELGKESPFVSNSIFFKD